MRRGVVGFAQPSSARCVDRISNKDEILLVATTKRGRQVAKAARYCAASGRTMAQCWVAVAYPYPTGQRDGQ